MAYMKLSAKPLVFCDVETSGLDPVVNEILEFAAIKGEETLVMKIKPRRIHTAHPKALEVNGYNEAEWADAVDIAEAAPKIIAFLRDAVFVAHNAKFDVGHIESFLREAGITERIDYHVVDTTGLAYIFLVRKGLESLSLKPVCEFLGLEPEPGIHRALAGASTCKRVYETLTGYIV
jgi:DNA polymerase III epsilon subunit-like protein